MAHRSWTHLIKIGHMQTCLRHFAFCCIYFILFGSKDIKGSTKIIVRSLKQNYFEVHWKKLLHPVNGNDIKMACCLTDIQGGRE